MIEGTVKLVVEPERWREACDESEVPDVVDIETPELAAESVREEGADV